MIRVLVVDDEPAVRRALERALRLESYEVAPRTARRRSTRWRSRPPTL
jgi:DNA-binding NtrC family response regulator